MKKKGMRHFKIKFEAVDIGFSQEQIEELTKAKFPNADFIEFDIEEMDGVVDG